MTEVTL